MLKKITPAEIALDLADDIEAKRVGHFDMSHYHDCGTPSCIAGHIVARHGNFEEAFELSESRALGDGIFFDRASSILGVSEDAAFAMFMPYDMYDTGRMSYYNTRAPSMLRHWAATGEVNWNVGEGA